jgi:hypothetical protein
VLRAVPPGPSTKNRNGNRTRSEREFLSPQRRVPALSLNDPGNRAAT